MIIEFGVMLEHLLEIGLLGVAASLTTGNIRYSLYNIERSLKWYNINLTCFSTI